MSEVNYRRNGKKYSSCGPSRGRLAPKVHDVPASERAGGPKPLSSRERHALKRGKKGK